MAPQIIFGDIREHDPDELESALNEAGIKRIDTAARYMNGESEKKIGRAKLPESFDIDTKILIELPGDGHLAADKIDKSLNDSLSVLGVDKVNTLYCHGPDFETPIAEQARAFDEHYKRGRFRYVCVGMSTDPHSAHNRAARGVKLPNLNGGRMALDIRERKSCKAISVPRPVQSSLSGL